MFRESSSLAIVHVLQAEHHHDVLAYVSSLLILLILLAGSNRPGLPSKKLSRSAKQDYQLSILCVHEYAGQRNIDELM